MHGQNKIRKSLKASFLDGIFASAMVGLTVDYITPYALALRATTSQIGILSAAPNLVSSLAQLKSADLVEKLKSRKKVINLFVFLHALMGLPIILVPYLFKAHAVLSLIIFVTLFTSLNAFAAPAWSSLMSDHIPIKTRGKYFGWRNKALGIVTIVSSFAAGSILFVFKNNILRGFLIIFSLAAICRFTSWYFLTRMFEPSFRIKKESYFSIWDFIRRARESNFAKFVIAAASLAFCVNVASPFFSVFMLRDLKFNYLTYTSLIITVSLTQIFLIDRWGRRADKFGNIKIIKFSSLFIAGLPFCWIINHNPFYLGFIQVLSGFAWAGYNLCAINFIYDAVSAEKRTRCIAFFSSFVGIATCLGALAGGFLANMLPQLFGYKLLSLFFISSILRFFVAAFLFPKVKEVRATERISHKELFYSVIGIKK